MFGHFIDEQLFGNRRGFVFGQQVDIEGVEFRWIFAMDDEELRREPVFGGVQTNLGFSRFGTRTGGVLRVGAIPFGTRECGAVTVFIGFGRSGLTP